MDCSSPPDVRCCGTSFQLDLRPDHRVERGIESILHDCPPPALAPTLSHRYAPVLVVTHTVPRLGPNGLDTASQGQGNHREVLIA
jgi:hypothetical protein